MVDLALPRQLHAIGQRAIVEAKARAAVSVEAEHLLLAILARPAEPAGRILARNGLDHLRLLTALDAARARSLAVAGVAMPAPSVLSATPRSTTPGWGASIRDVLRNANRKSAKDGRAGALETE